jgi:N utilization substance protein A
VRVVVPDFQLSLAIGREGQNARLAARLTGWRIDIHSDAEDAPAAPASRPGAADQVPPAVPPRAPALRDTPDREE